jgi:hypothetical protein
MVWEDSSNRWSCLENWGVGFLDFFLNFVFLGMGSASALEHYFQRLPGRDGSGPSSSSSSAGAASLIASSSDAQKRAAHSVCHIPQKRKSLQPLTTPQRRSNPAVKLLTPTVDVQDIGSTENEDRGVGGVNEVPGGMIEVSTTVDHETIVLDSAEEHKDDEDDDFQLEPPLKTARRSYDGRRKFQLSWVARCLWAEALEISGITMVKCTTCSIATGKPTILALKIATLQRHQGNYSANRNMAGGVKKGDRYIASTCRHLKNEQILASRGVRPIDEAVQDIVGEKTRKQQQMGVIFHLLSTGRPMVDYSGIRPMLQFLGVPKLTKRHWSDGAGWMLADCMFRQVEAKALETVRASRFISLSCDEVTSIDNGSWISIHCYVVQNWSRVPILISLERVQDQATSTNLLNLILSAVKHKGGVYGGDLVQKFMSFGVGKIRNPQDQIQPLL